MTQDELNALLENDNFLETLELSDISLDDAADVVDREYLQTRAECVSSGWGND